MLTLIQPAPDCPQFGDLAMEVRDEVRRWMWAFQEIGISKPIGGSLARIARALSVSPKTARRKYDALRKSGGHWTAFLDNRKVGGAAAEARTQDKEFLTFLATLAEKYQRKSAPAIKALHRAWAARTTIPGYNDFPGWPATPEGWSNRNLARLIKEACDARHLASIRVSTSSKTRAGSMLPQVFTTRVGLWPGAVIQLDDVWHDNFVSVGKDRRTTRVLELGALDLFSGCRFHWGAKPRMPKADGSGMENLKEREMRFFLAAILWNFGYSPRGTRFMAEHGTAAIREDIARILSDATGGLIEVRRQPIEGKQKALTGFWNGSEGGNFRAKAALESVHNLIHNELSFLSLQTGLNPDERPVTTDIQLSYIARVMREVIAKVPHRAELLRLPALDFHSQFLPFLNDYYEFGLNGRTDHDLEGWAKLGFKTTEYTTVPGSGHYLSREQFLALPPASQAVIRAAAQADPKAWTNKRNLSPREIWTPAVPDMRRIPAHVVCDILSRDLARELKVEGSYLRFEDIDISPEALIYEAAVKTQHGVVKELPHGERYLCFANPFAPKQLFVCDAKGAMVGIAPLVKKISGIDDAALAIEAGHKHARTAAILQPLRLRHEEAVAEAQDLRAHNARVVSGKPVTDEEIAAARSEAGRKGQRTTAANRLQQRGKAVDWDAVPAAAPAPFDPLASLPDDEPLPDSL
jgi:hypothetical protein